MYSLLRKIMFTMEPEKAHRFAMGSMQKIQKTGIGSSIVNNIFSVRRPELEKELFSLHFKNPVGLAAGFDKNAAYLQVLQTLGFGFVEIGTVTPKPQSGNARPRMFRLTKDKALINRMGFNNEGAEIINTRLRLYRQNRKNKDLIIGVNIGKNKQTSNEDAWKDYNYCFKTLHEAGDYFVVNVSSPNTPGLRALQDKDSLRKIFDELKNINLQSDHPKPLLLKIAPDLTDAQLDDIIQLTDEVGLHGLIATNTTISRSNLITPVSLIDSIGAGGLSGMPLKKRSTEIIRYLSQNLTTKIPIIASGGIMNGADAKEKIMAGASLVQVYTGFVYYGPSIAKDICKAIV